MKITIFLLASVYFLLSCKEFTNTDQKSVQIKNQELWPFNGDGTWMKPCFGSGDMFATITFVIDSSLGRYRTTTSSYGDSGCKSLRFSRHETGKLIAPRSIHSHFPVDIYTEAVHAQPFTDEVASHFSSKNECGGVMFKSGFVTFCKNPDKQLNQKIELLVATQPDGREIHWSGSQGEPRPTEVVTEGIRMQRAPKAESVNIEGPTIK